MPRMPQISEDSSAADRDPAPPRGLSRSEKSAFRRVCELRRAAGRPVAAIESDIVVDYLAARSRLAELQRVEREEQADSVFFLKDRIALAAAVDRAAGTCRRLAKDLMLIGAA
ncbi:hypothetical protein ASE63_18495 [Bosea sp. Root381]|nr:hypothetical protein ASE63_18495 [Bosea sp. Root381]